MNAPQILVALALLAGAPLARAEASTPKASSLEQLKQEAQLLAGALANAADCEFRIEETRMGLTLRVRDSHGASAYLDVPAESAIALEEQLLSGDGSSALLFTVPGQGSLRLVQACDAFARAELTDRDGQVLSCELDF